MGGNDADRLHDEIATEVRRRRERGELDPTLERELDSLFQLAAPAGVTGDIAALLDRAQRATAIDASPPVASQRTGGAAVKGALGRAMSWYVGHVARQVGELGTALVEALRVLAARVERLEAASAGTSEAVRAAARLDPHVDLSPWVPALADLLEGSRGRVLHGDAGDGTVVRALVQVGLDAYGTEPRPPFADVAASGALEVRETATPEHVAALPAESLGALVLSGCVDTLPPRALQELAVHASGAVAPGGKIVVVATHASRWGDGDTAVVADLAPGRPLGCTTWQHLLERAGFSRVEHVAGPTPQTSAVTGGRSLA